MYSQQQFAHVETVYLFYIRDVTFQNDVYWEI